MKKNFTLIESIVVITIIALLASIITPQALNTLKKVKAVKVIGIVDLLKKACQNFYIDTGRYAIELIGSAAGGAPDWNQLSKEQPLLFGWDGPYTDHEMTFHEIPFKNDTRVLNHNHAAWTCQAGLCGFDLDGDGYIDINGDGNTLVFRFTTDENLRQKVNNIIDGEEGANWTLQGRVEYNPTSDSALSIYLIGE